MKSLFSPNRAATKYVEQIQSELIDGLAEPSVAQELGDVALELTALAEGMFIPNVRGGVVSLPQEYMEKDGTAVIVLKDNESLLRDTSMIALSPAQRISLASQAGRFEALDPAESDEDSLAQLVDNGLQTIYNPNAAGHSPDIIEASHLGQVTVKFVTFKARAGKKLNAVDVSDFLFSGRPLVTLQYVKTGLSSEVLAHELYHVKKREIDPTLPNNQGEICDFGWREELEAFNLSARYGRKVLQLGFFHASGKAGLGHSLDIEECRAYHNDASDPFFPHPAIKEVFPNLY